MEVEYPNARVFPVPLEPSVRCELEDRFVLVYTGKSHFSSGMHQKVISEADQHRADFDALAHAAVAGKEALLTGDLDAFAAAMNANWAAQKRLHPDITTPEIEALHGAAFRAGALGFKANGAGGGGTVTILADGTTPPGRPRRRGPGHDRPARADRHDGPAGLGSQVTRHEG